MDNLEPITRNEMFLNGDDLEPITREEMILAGADLEPLTRHEWFLKKYRGGGGGGGYDLVNVPNLPADIASFTDGTDLPMASLKVAVTPYQDLSHGDPSPDNICPIIGWDEAVVTVADDAENPTTSHEYTIDLNGTRYGGEVDVLSGVLTVDRIKWTLTPTASQIAGVSFSDCIISIPSDKTPVDWNVNVNKCMCNKLKVSNYSAQHDNHVHFPNSSLIALYLEDEVGTTKQDWVDYLAQAQIDISYIIATPLTIQLTPTQVKSLEGKNNISANCGDIIELEYFSKEV